jgi:cell division protein FtsI/penicillin-binding protein 2
MVHYLEVIALLHGELSRLTPEELSRKGQGARDPLTRWAADALSEENPVSLELFLQRALDRRYSASPVEVFFTGGGLQTFGNFDPLDDHRIFSLREAFQRSSNLVFIRLMRDLVRFHRARLPYDPDAVLANVKHPERRRLLGEIAEEESRAALLKAYRTHQGLAPEAMVSRVLGGRAKSPRHLAILFLAWKKGAGEQALGGWLHQHLGAAAPEDVAKLYRSYGNPRLTIADYGYLLSVHPLDLWAAGELARQPGISWEELWQRSAAVRQTSSAWLFNTRNRRAQDLRLRIRAEKDAFALMAPYWKRLGFPFNTMVPSYATAIGNSSDRPAALAELMGIIVNDGVRAPLVSMKKLRFARGMPYETLLEPAVPSGAQVLEPAVARALKVMLAEVVEMGTARRLKGAFVRADGTPITVGGKTGSGDNRFETFDRRGAVLTSRATNRTAALVFYIGDRYFGVISAFVDGPEAARYRFTSALPAALLRILAPAIAPRFDAPGSADPRLVMGREPAAKVGFP